MDGKSNAVVKPKPPAGGALRTAAPASTKPIWMADKVTQTRVADLKPYANNNRIHTPTNIGKLKASVGKFGFVAPILVDSDCVIIAGHGRLDPAGTQVATIDLAADSLLADTQKLGCLSNTQQVVLLLRQRGTYARFSSGFGGDGRGELGIRCFEELACCLFRQQLHERRQGRSGYALYLAIFMLLPVSALSGPSIQRSRSHDPWTKVDTLAGLESGDRT